VTFGPDNEDIIQVGTIVASTSTSGSNADADGYAVRLDEARNEPIDANGVVTFSSVKAGTYDVLLDGFASNCSVTGSNPVYVLLPADSIREAHFDVVCN
jgi:hypothetical protein